MGRDTVLFNPQSRQRRVASHRGESVMRQRFSRTKEIVVERGEERSLETALNCPSCGAAMRLTRTIPRRGAFRKLAIAQCWDCGEVLTIEERHPQGWAS
jgi:transcription elongation factor Elf1